MIRLADITRGQEAGRINNKNHEYAISYTWTGIKNQMCYVDHANTRFELIQSDQRVIWLGGDEKHGEGWNLITKHYSFRQFTPIATDCLILLAVYTAFSKMSVKRARISFVWSTRLLLITQQTISLSFFHSIWNSVALCTFLMCSAGDLKMTFTGTWYKLMKQTL